MTATDELRRMLDERGVEWQSPTSFDGTARYDTTAGGYWFHEFNGKITIHGLTPEQAVEATLGREACHRRPHVNLTIGDSFLKQSGWDCSECGCRLDLPVIARYCSNCGRKVVDA